MTKFLFFCYLLVLGIVIYVAGHRGEQIQALQAQLATCEAVTDALEKVQQ